MQGLLDDTVTTELRGGDLVVSWQGDDHPVLMTGPATFVFEGTIEAMTSQANAETQPTEPDAEPGP